MTSSSGSEFHTPNHNSLAPHRVSDSDDEVADAAVSGHMLMMRPSDNDAAIVPEMQESSEAATEMIVKQTMLAQPKEILFDEESLEMITDYYRACRKHCDSHWFLSVSLMDTLMSTTAG